MRPCYFVLTLLLTPTAMAEEPEAPEPETPVEVHGYLDAQGVLSSVEDESTFTMHDAAIQVGMTEGAYSAMIDLPASGGMRDNTLTVGAGKAQAYVGAEYDNGTYWTFGQFDGPTGFENNDSVLNPLSRTSAFISSITLSTLTGAKVGYTKGAFDGFLVVADPEGGGLMVGGPLFGGGVAADNDTLRGYTAFVTEIRDDGLWYMADLIVGASFADNDLDVELFVTDEPGAPRQAGTMLYWLMRADQKTSGAVLLEAGQDVGTHGLGVGGHLGPQVHVNEHFMVRIDGGIVAMEGPAEWEMAGSGRLSTAIF